MTRTHNELLALAKQAEHSCHHAMLAIIEFNLMVDVNEWRVAVKGMKAGIIQGTNLEFLNNDRETIVRIAISRAAVKEVEHGDA
jgi:hypothetical protein